MIPISKLPYSVLIQTKSVTYDSEGVATKSYNTAATIRADVQPLDGEIGRREYGITETGITDRMFCNPSEEVQLARRVVHKGKNYEIRHVASYRGHMEVLLRPEVT